DEIIFRLGGGIAGVAETKIYFVSSRTGHKEIWAMDYDGQNQHQITHLGSISLSPAVSPDGSRIAFSSLVKGGWDIQIYSLDLNRLVAFPRLTGTNLSPSWSPDGAKLAFSSSWNRKSGAELSWTSGRSGLPQIYSMSSDGTNVQRYTDQGYAVSPSWSPSGQLLLFSWIRHYGPGAPGGADIYTMDIASKKWGQLTHDSGRNDFPSWAPDGRHIVFESNRAGGEQ